MIGHVGGGDRPVFWWSSSSAAGGEARSIQLLCGLLQASEARPSPSDLEQPSEADQEVLRELQRRMKEASS